MFEMAEAAPAVGKGLIIAALLFGATAIDVRASDWWPEVKIGQIDQCNSTPGFVYQGEWSHRDDFSDIILGEVCVSPGEGWIVGPTTITGMTKIKNSPGHPDNGRYAVIADSAEEALRRGVALNPSSERFPFPFSPGIRDLSVRGPRSVFQQISYGFLYDGTSAPLGTLPDGKWLVWMEPMIFKGMSTSVDLQLMDDVRASAAAWIMEATENGTRVVSWSETHKEPRIDIAVTAGDLAGSLSYRIENDVLPAGREQGDYDWAAYEFHRLLGRALQTETGEVFIAVGAGRVTPHGITHVGHPQPIAFIMVAGRIPDDVPDALIVEHFGTADQPPSGQ